MTSIYLALQDTVVRVPNGSDGWTREDVLDGYRFECVAVTEERPDRVFVGTFDGGLLRSRDGGATFDRVGGEAIDHDSVMSIAISPHDPDEIWVGTEPSELYRSVDAGASWSHVPGISDLPSADEWFFPPRPHTHHVRWIELDPTDPASIYVGIEAGAFVRSVDGGATWTERPPGSRRDNHTLATHPAAPNRLYAAAGDGYAESADRGATWEHPHRGLDHRYVWGLAVDPGDPDTVIVSAARGAGAAHRPPGDAHLYRKTAPSGPWVRLEDPTLPIDDGALRAILLAGSAAGELVGATDRGLFRTPDGGDSWQRIPIEWPDDFVGQTTRGLAVVDEAG